MEYDAVCPFGFERDNVHAAMISATVANNGLSILDGLIALGGRRPKQRKAILPSQFMLKDPEPKPSQNKVNADRLSVFAAKAVRKRKKNG